MPPNSTSKLRSMASHDHHHHHHSHDHDHHHHHSHGCERVCPHSSCATPPRSHFSHICSDLTQARFGFAAVSGTAVAMQRGDRGSGRTVACGTPTTASCCTPTSPSTPPATSPSAHCCSPRAPSPTAPSPSELAAPSARGKLDCFLLLSFTLSNCW